MIFTSLAFAQIGQALAVRSGTDSLFRAGLHSNMLMLAMVCAVAALQLLVIYLPPLQSFFSTTPLSFAELVLCIGIGVIVFGAIEIEKLFKREDRNNAPDSRRGGLRCLVE